MSSPTPSGPVLPPRVVDEPPWDAEEERGGEVVLGDNPGRPP